MSPVFDRHRRRHTTTPPQPAPLLDLGFRTAAVNAELGVALASLRQKIERAFAQIHEIEDDDHAR